MNRIDIAAACALIAGLMAAISFFSALNDKEIEFTESVLVLSLLGFIISLTCAACFQMM